VTSPQTIELSPAEASELIQHELQEAHHAFHTADLESALDRFVSALGLALQLGPAVIERVLTEVMAAAREMARQQNANSGYDLWPAWPGSDHGTRPSLRHDDKHSHPSHSLGRCHRQPFRAR